VKQAEREQIVPAREAIIIFIRVLDLSHFLFRWKQFAVPFAVAFRFS
jgi:hypothetical protein